jgi:hypothetical protein
MFLMGIVMGIITCISFTVILVIMGVHIGTAFPLAYTIALSVFGAFLCKVYRMTTREPAAIKMAAIGQSIERPKTQKCLILAARTHGALQDRANYWLSGRYGEIKSSAVSATEKGIFMTIFYEASGTPESLAVGEGNAIREVPSMKALTPLRNFSR